MARTTAERPPTRRDRPVRTPASRLWLFSLATTLGLLALLEGGSRLLTGHVEFPPDPLVTGTQQEWAGKRRYDPLLFWRMRPLLTNQHGPVTNSLGLRGPEIPPAKGGEFRVLSLGESTTYASRFPYAECYSAILERRLGRVADRSVRVINGGVPGYSLFQGYTYFEREGVDLEPDAVLLYFGYNDFLGVAFRARRDYRGSPETAGLTDRELFRERIRWPSRLLDGMLRYSNAARWLGSAARGRSESVAGEGDSDSGSVLLDPDRPRVPEADRLWLLENFRQLCAQRGIDLVIVVPWYREFEEHIPLLRRFAGEHDVAIVDLPQRLASLPRPRSEYFVDNVHPGREGHRLIADAIVDVVRDRWRGRNAPSPARDAARRRSRATETGAKTARIGSTDLKPRGDAAVGPKVARAPRSSD